MKASNLLI